MRYGIHKGSMSGHCCFEFTVVDLTKPEILGGKHYQGSDGQYHYESICECWTEEQAKLVCAALNCYE